jgi:hypothetical protein
VLFVHVAVDLGPVQQGGDDQAPLCGVESDEGGLARGQAPRRVTDEPPTVRLVLDTTAVARLVRGAVSVGELLAEIDAEHGTPVVPLPCLIEAAPVTVAAGPWVSSLIDHPATSVVATDVDEWRRVAEVRSLVGAYEPAAGAWQALAYAVDDLTRTPELTIPGEPQARSSGLFHQPAAQLRVHPMLLWRSRGEGRSRRVGRRIRRGRCSA